MRRSGLLEVDRQTGHITIPVKAKAIANTTAKTEEAKIKDKEDPYAKMHALAKTYKKGQAWQYRAAGTSQVWTDIPNDVRPGWFLDCEYRLKPILKPKSKIAKKNKEEARLWMPEIPKVVKPRTPRKRQARWLQPGDTVVTAFFETNEGPGWVNTLIWVIVQDADKKLRREALQKEDYGWSPELMAIRPYSEQGHQDMRTLVNGLIYDMPKKRYPL